MQRVRVIYHHEDDAWWAESPDVQGYSAAAGSLTELRGLVAEGLPLLMENDAVAVYEGFPDEIQYGRHMAVTDVLGRDLGGSLTVVMGKAAASTVAAKHGPRTTVDTARCVSA